MHDMIRHDYILWMNDCAIDRREDFHDANTWLRDEVVHDDVPNKTGQADDTIPNDGDGASHKVPTDATKARISIGFAMWYKCRTYPYLLVGFPDDRRVSGL